MPSDEALKAAREWCNGPGSPYAVASTADVIKVATLLDSFAAQACDREQLRLLAVLRDEVKP